MILTSTFDVVLSNCITIVTRTVHNNYTPNDKPVKHKPDDFVSFYDFAIWYWNCFHSVGGIFCFTFYDYFSSKHATFRNCSHSVCGMFCLTFYDYFSSKHTSFRNCSHSVHGIFCFTFYDYFSSKHATFRNQNKD